MSGEQLYYDNYMQLGVGRPGVKCGSADVRILNV